MEKLTLKQGIKLTPKHRILLKCAKTITCIRIAIKNPHHFLLSKPSETPSPPYFSNTHWIWATLLMHIRGIP